MCKQIEVRFETITPQRARELLASNLHNRNLSKTRVHYYAEIMKRGEWDGKNGESIKIAEDGTLVDGQHRLAAVVESGVPVVMMVVYNVSIESQETLDQGRARTLSDMLKMRGYRNTIFLASVTRALVRWDSYSPESAFRSFGASGAYTVTNGECFDFIEAHGKQIYESMCNSTVAARTLRVRPMIFGTLYYKLSEAAPDYVDEFFSLLASGDGLHDGDPIYMLRQYLLRIAIKPNVTASAVWVAAITIKSWNAWLEGREVRQLKYAMRGNNPESFPVIQRPAESVVDE